MQRRFRRLDHPDLPTLVDWFADPAVAAWWGPPVTFADVQMKYEPRIAGREPTTMWIVEFDGAPGGLLQHYLHTDYPEHDRAVGVPDAAGIDYLLASAFRGRGLAGDVLRDFASMVLDRYPTITSVVATPAQDNEPSCRTLERAGFTRRGTCHPPEEPPAVVYALDRTP